MTRPGKIPVQAALEEDVLTNEAFVYLNFQITGMTRPRNNPGASGIRTRDLGRGDKKRVGHKVEEETFSGEVLMMGLKDRYGKKVGLIRKRTGKKNFRRRRKKK